MIGFSFILGALATFVLALPPAPLYSTCDYPPSYLISKDPTCAQGAAADDPRFNCHGARFVRSAGFYMRCDDHSDCYRNREPNDWCHLPEFFHWSFGGCHCDKKIRSCVMERKNDFTKEYQWAYCTPQREFTCNALGRCSS
ncbi:unnamed protein product [Caenorhabditis auriculariae]|uniref:Domain of unknown function DX domain-containing protein n=1 Tax=Caenorhabditis auriculariae TaxID=2777116 RepID=A0A8S1H8Z4_9PELO|nr:unnamed protein product [Caenorhabditis auriculariae]